MGEAIGENPNATLLGESSKLGMCLRASSKGLFLSV